MKKLFPTLAIACLAWASGHGQITIFADDVSPTDVEASLAFDLTPDPSLDPTGFGQVAWDFSALADDSVAVYKFVEPSGTPYASTFADANLASEQGDSYYYFKIDNNGLSALGLYGALVYDTYNVTTSIEVNPPQSILRFPAALNDGFTETVVRKAQVDKDATGDPNFPFDSVRFVSTVEREVSLDAYGSMTTPLGTFETIRSSEMETITDQIFVYSATTGIWSPLPAGSPYTNQSYSWWTNENNFGFPVVQVQYEPGDGVISASWVQDFVSGANERNLLQFSLYPNPAPHQLFVQLPEPFAGTLEVRNLHGLVMETQAIDGDWATVSTESFVNGSYVLVLRNEQGQLVGRKPFQVLR